MGQQEASRHNEIHEGGYGSPMPEDEMPAPPNPTGSRQPAEVPGVEPQGPGTPDGDKLP
ncbi:hypothetical protein QO003_001016 [Arthrobacter silviterrae]|uniref:Uncharacterized protein n=1 Tax=Arthrobacter silviterrae TaxID=2026658 RepID=A0ABX0DEE5_9MICC|nr:hypothetical protein [Arthrobacter silviterrae]MDQ0276713.1 hypothetical protein [Arthrobacter silviterrae]NGN84096.1 hypothetical protein [Arthrobacter silviterrae]